MSAIYSRLALEPEFKPKPNLNRSENTLNLLKAIPKKDRVTLRRHFQDYMKQMRTNEGIFRLPFENGLSENPFYTHRTIAREQIDALTKYSRHHGATLNDLLIAAVFRAQTKAAKWDGKKHLRINTTVDLRRHLEGKQATAITNLSLTLGSWPNLGKDLGVDLSDTLKKVTAATKARKTYFFGLDMFVYAWPMFRYVPHGLAIKLVHSQIAKNIKQDNCPDTFTNTGVIEPTDVTFGCRPISARVLPPPIYPPYYIFAASGYDGTLTLSFAGYPVHKDLAECFFDSLVDELMMK